MPAKVQAKRSGSHQGTCSECRRRHQKVCQSGCIHGNYCVDWKQCISRGEGPCLNCLRRYPPPVCTSYVEPEPGSQGTKHKFPSRTRKIIPVETRTPHEDLTPVALLSSESPRAIGGVLSAVNGWNTIAIEPTSRNAELFHMCKPLIAESLIISKLNP